MKAHKILDLAYAPLHTSVKCGVCVCVRVCVRVLERLCNRCKGRWAELNYATLALQLNHPGRLLNLFTNVVNIKTPDVESLTGLTAVDDVLAKLSDEQLFLLLLRLRDWNTNARTAPVAQRILGALIKSYPASRFSNLSVRGARGQKSLGEVLNALKVYTERHYKRMEELVDESYLMEYTLQEMDGLAPPIDRLQLGSGTELDEDVIMASWQGNRAAVK